MAIQLVGYITKSADGSTSFDISGTWTGGIGGPLQQNDVVFYAAVADAQAVANPTGWTQIYNEGDPTDIQMSWKRMGSSPDTSISPIEESDGVRHVAIAFRGVDPTTAFDATTVGPTQGDSGMPNSASITTVTDNAWVLSVGFIDDDDASEATAPSGYTKILALAQVGSLSTQMWAYKVKSPAGAEDPGAWSSSDTDAWTAFTIALRPAPGGGLADTNDTVTVSETIAKAASKPVSESLTVVETVDPVLTPPMPAATRYTVGPTDATISIYASPALTVADSARKHLVINIHGTNRNAGEYHQWALNGLALTSKRDETIIVSPYFRDNNASAGSDPEGIGYVSTDLYWTSTGWRLGSKDASTYDYSSFDVLDDLIEGIIASGNFPNLERITVCGHSAGGQMTTRYCLVNEIDGITVSIPMRYVPSNPSSYCYPDEYRPQFDGSWNVTGYFIPSVTGYNDYRYGLAGTTNAYIDRSTDATHAARFKARYHEPLLGEYDDIREVADPDFDSSAEANTQGQHRKMRGQVFKAYMDNRFPGNKHKEAIIVAAVGHDGQNMWDSPEGRAHLFETYNKDLSDGVSVTENLVLPLTDPAPADSVSATDALVASLSKALSDSAAPTDAQARAVGKALADTATPTETIAKHPGKALSDSAAGADAAPVLATGKALSDSATAADATPAAALAKAVSDSVLVDDDRLIGADGLSRADSVTATDAVTVALSKPVSDTAPATDAAVNHLSRTTAESLTATDAVVPTLSVPLSDSVAATDALSPFAVSKAVVDTVAPTETVGKALSRAIADTVAVADAATTSDGTEEFVDTVTLKDGGTWIKQSYVNGDYFAELYVEGQTGDINPPLVLGDSVTVADSTVAGINRSLSLNDTADAADAPPAFHVGQALEDDVEAESDTLRRWVRTRLYARHVTGPLAKANVNAPQYRPRVQAEYDIGRRWTIQEGGPVYLNDKVVVVDDVGKFYPPHPDENAFPTDFVGLDFSKVLTDSVPVIDEFGSNPLFPADPAPAIDSGEIALRNYVDMAYEAEVYVAAELRSI